ncbi:calmodulin-binding receptor-like cytoplasmic kinase 2 isoform X2 [Phragmites australis]|uniref:calmodulin-binding receptor-like cytoplasmic kinase 2 isoform X2 n=1 Tax=Phragmites australis TaxID=29695 RepID=UPI002D78E1BA|nr:calmodulin-binding receptor-like cytoplasmic kinase 2 isoform X2 [Phragmites australis]
MASPAAKRQFITRKSAELSGTGAHRPYDLGRPSFSPDVYGRQISSDSVRSSAVSRSGSFKAAAQRVAGAFSSCFVPRIQFKTEEEREKSGAADHHVSTDSGSWQESRVLTIADICKATSNFSEKNIVRQGASSTMYRGKLKDGSPIAIKCVRKLNDQYLTAELWRELETLQNIEHPNLARFLGFFKRKEDSLIVVEYLSNGSLREHLDESRGNGLELAQRLNIAIDVAHAITYLHENTEQPIVHGSIRSSGVLLTDALTAKVAGFGLAGTAASGSGSGSEATPVKGAAGYVDPEYLSTYQLTDKSDVYSFGVLLVELVTGRPPVERSHGGEARLTTKWALQKYRGGEAVVAMDPRMRRSPATVAAVEKMLALAEQCVTPARKDRPSMRRCTEQLWTIRRDYHRREESHCTAVAEERSDEWVVR